MRATPGRVYRAFIYPDAMAKWLPPNKRIRHMDYCDDANLLVDPTGAGCVVACLAGGTANGAESRALRWRSCSPDKE